MNSSFLFVKAIPGKVPWFSKGQIAQIACSSSTYCTKVLHASHPCKKIVIRSPKSMSQSEL